MAPAIIARGILSSSGVSVACGDPKAAWLGLLPTARLGGGVRPTALPGRLGVAAVKGTTAAAPAAPAGRLVGLEGLAPNAASPCAVPCSVSVSKTHTHTS